MKILKKYPWVLLILAAVVIFFYPVFKGQIPFPGDLLVNTNPYNSNSYLGYSPGGFPNKAQGPDVIYEIYPWRYFSITQLKQLSIPFWNPYNFSGNPQMANFQTAIFYPFNIIYFVLPFNISWTILIMLQPLLAGILMYLFLRKSLGLKDFPSFIGAISFGFSSYMTVWLEYGNIGSTFLWLPLVLYLTKSFFNTKRAKFILGLIISLSLAILAGYIQGIFYIYALCLAYYLFLAFNKNEVKKEIKNHMLFLISLALPFFITAFQLLPTLQLFLQSTRGDYSFLQIEKNLAPIVSWITIVVPDFFGNPATRNYWIDGTYIERVLYPGSVILFFAFYSILNKVQFLEKKFFIVLSLISLAIATNLPFIKYFYLIPIPVISTTIPTREFSVFIFSLIVLGSFGIDAFLKNKSPGKKMVAIYSIGLLLIWLYVLTFYKSNPNLKIAEHNLILPTVFAFLIIFSTVIYKRFNKASILLISAIVFFDLFYFFTKITPFSDASLIYPKTEVISYLQQNSGINRFWGYGSAYIPANFQSVDSTFSPEGNDPLHISAYGELLSSSANGKLPQSLPRPDANIAPGYGQEDLKTNFYRKRVLDLLGVKYMLNKQEALDLFLQADKSTFPEKEYSLIYKQYPFQVYENKNSIPRFFVTGEYVLAKDKNQALAYLYNPKIDLSKTIILQEPVNVKTDPNVTSKADLISYTPNKVKIQTSSSGEALLFLSDNYYYEWNAKIDGKLTNILLADYTFRAVSIPKGTHTVEFFYNPISFNKGIILSLSTIVFILLSIFYVKKINKI